MHPTSSLILAAFLATLIGGCAATKDTHGYIIDKELVASVQPGVDNKQSVRQALGAPTLIGEWDKDTWYYISRQTAQRSFHLQRLKNQDVLIVRFAPNGTVGNVERRGAEEVAAIAPISDKTKISGHKEGLFEALFGNIGAVGAAGAPGAGGPP